MINPRGKKLTAKAARELLNNVPHLLDPEMSYALMGQVYMLKDGAAVFVDVDGRGIHFASHNDLVNRYRRNLNAARERKHPLEELLPAPERFVAAAASLASRLPALLVVDEPLLDFSLDSLAVVDGAVRRLGSHAILTSEVFPSFVAYIGEVIRRQINGAWIVHEVGGARQELDLADSTGGRYGLLRLHKQLLEHGRSASMRAFVHGVIGTQRMLPKVLPAKNKRPT